MNLCDLHTEVNAVADCAMHGNELLFAILVEYFFSNPEVGLAKVQ